MSHMLIELYTVTPAWRALDPVSRGALGTLQQHLAELAGLPRV